MQRACSLLEEEPEGCCGWIRMNGVKRERGRVPSVPPVALHLPATRAFSELLEGPRCHPPNAQSPSTVLSSG